MLDITIRLETSDDHSAIQDIHLAAFSGDPVIPSLVAELRDVDGYYRSVSLVALDKNGTPQGHVMLSHAWLDTWDRMVDVMVLSPLGVHPDQQGQGIGTALIDAALANADKLNVPIVFLEGNNRYYGPRGFQPAVAQNIRRPSLRMPDLAFQMIKLSAYRKGMTGTFVYRDVHWKHGVGLYR